MSSVLIVGAGIAGISAARELSRYGIVCNILEGRGRIGGRIWSELENRPPGWVELGAEFIHGFPSETLRFSQESALPVYEVPDRHLSHQGNEIKEMPDFWDRISGALKGNPLLDTSFRQYLERKGIPELERRLALNFVEEFYAADPELISQKSIESEMGAIEETDASRSLRIYGGYRTLIQALLGSSDKKLIKIHFDETVREVSWEKGRVEVNGYQASALVMTAPPGPLKRIRFLPELPEKTEALESLMTGSVLKVVIFFREPFWERRSNHDLSFIHSTDCRYFPTWWSTAPFQWPVLTGWTGGPRARDLARLNEEDLRPVACASLAKIFDMNQRSISDLIESVHFHDWQSDPFSQGAYGYIKVGGSDAPGVLAQPVEGTLFFAGEATESKGVHGTVEGGLISGLRTAREVLNAIQSRSRKAA